MFSLRRTVGVIAMAAALTLGVGAPAAATASAPSGRAAAQPSEVSTAATHGPIGPGFSACPRGNFCAWIGPHAAVAGHRWTGNDPNWRNNYLFDDVSINNNDMSWANHGTSCAGCDHVRVYAGLRYSNARTICLAPGQNVRERLRAGKRGSSHSWAARC